MMHQAAERARAMMRCCLKGEFRYMTPGRKGPAQTGERGRYLWVPVGENGLLGAELTCCVSRSTHSYKGVPTNPRLSAVRRLVWYSCVFVLRFDAPPSFLRNFPAWHSREKKRCSFDVPHGSYKLRVPDTAISPTSGPLALRPHARRSRRDTVREFLSKLPRASLGSPGDDPRRVRNFSSKV